MKTRYDDGLQRFGNGVNRGHGFLLIVLVSMLAVFSAQAFQHPGIPLTIADLNYLKTNLNTEPWNSGYASLIADGHSSTNYTMQGPFGYVNRNNAGNYDHQAEWISDMTAVYNLARRWYFTGDANYAKKSHDILISWATTQTNYGGIEASFDLGGYAYRYAGGADILRGTWPGWTAADTATVSNYFNNVFWPNLALPGPVPTGSQGMEPLAAAAAIAVFNDDTNKFNQVLSSFLTDADAGLRDTLANGEVGDTGRDQGHTSLYTFLLAWTGEVYWKQGVDVFSSYDNRIHACGEYYARYNLPGSAPAFVPMGAPFWGPFLNISGAPRSSTQNRTALNILHGAYAVRKGLSSAWIDAYCNDQVEDSDSFMHRKSADSSVATPAVVTALPTASVSTGLTSADLNGCTPAGSTTYGGGMWTLQAGYNGGDPWNGGADTIRFASKQITGDFVMVTKVASIANVGSTHAKAGIMLRDSLGTAVNEAWIAITPGTNYERCLFGWTVLPYGANAAKVGFSISQPFPYWVKMERVGQRIQTYTSINGGDWSPAGTADFANLPATMYLGLFNCSQVNGTLGTATFTDVRMTGGDGGEAVKTPPAPFAIYASPGVGQVALHWNESFTATSYNVKRATASGGPYTTITNVPSTTCTDPTAANGTTYYYVVTAVNAAGESANSIQDSVTPQPAMVNVAVGGTASASAGSGTEGPAQAFNLNPGSKWFNGNGGNTGWLQYDLGQGNSQTVTSYAITSANDVPGRDPKNWQFQGSNDGSTWTTLDTQSNQSFAYRYQTLTFVTGNTTGYRYYRLNITANNGDATGVQLSELALLITASIPVPPPVAPTSLMATAGDAQVSLTWSTSSGATSYNVKRATVNGGPYTTITNIATASFTDNGLVNGTTYYYVVSALNAGGESGNSTQAIATPQVSAPSTPTGLLAIAGNAQVGLSWNASPGATSYNVKRATVNGGPYSTITNVASTSFTDTSVVNGTTYYYVVSALNAGGESGNSAQASATPQVAAPATPVGLIASGGNAQVGLSWNASAGATSYNLKRATVSGGPYTTITNIVGTSVTDIGVVNGTTYYYVVSALNAGGESANSSQASATPQAPASLPSPWVTADIGAVGATGSASYNAGTFTINGSGADIWNTADEFRFVYQPSSGTCEMRARVATVQNTDVWAKSGVMIRESTAAGARYAAVFITPGSGVAFQWRATTGGTCSNVQVTGVTAPRYVRIQRASSNSFRAYYSSNGTSWTQIGSNQTISMASSAVMGLAVTSHNDGVICTSTLDSVTATP